MLRNSVVLLVGIARTLNEEICCVNWRNQRRFQMVYDMPDFLRVRCGPRKCWVFRT